MVGFARNLVESLPELFKQLQDQNNSQKHSKTSDDFLKMLILMFFLFGLLFWSLSCLKSSGRLLGPISTKFRANPRSYDQRRFFVISIFMCFYVFLPVILVLELFKKLRETPENNFHQVSSKSEPGRPSNLILSHVISCNLIGK